MFRAFLSRFLAPWRPTGEPLERKKTLTVQARSRTVDRDDMSNFVDYLPPLVYAAAVAVKVLCPQHSNSKLIRLLEAECDAFLPALKHHVDPTIKDEPKPPSAAVPAARKPATPVRPELNAVPVPPDVTLSDLARLAQAIREQQPEAAPAPQQTSSPVMLVTENEEGTLKVEHIDVYV